MARCIDDADGGDTEQPDADGEHAVIQLQPSCFRTMAQLCCQSEAECTNVLGDEAADDTSKHQ